MMALWTATLLLLSVSWTLTLAMVDVPQGARAANSLSSDSNGRVQRLNPWKRQAAQSTPTPTICTTQHCYDTAKTLKEYMDPTVDPCVDFEEYSCGGFRRKYPIPKDSSGIDAFKLIRDKNNRLFQELLNETVKSDDEEVVKKVKNFYKFCMDEKKIEEIGLSIYKSSPEIKMWPTLTAQGNDDFDLQNLTEHYEKVFTGGIFNYHTAAVSNISMNHTLQFVKTYFAIDIDTYRNAKRDHPNIMASQQYYFDMAFHLGADCDVAYKDAKELVDFEIQLAKLTRPWIDFFKDPKLKINPMTLSEMTKRFPYLDWVRVVKAIYSSMPEVTITEDQVINIYDLKYFEGLGALLNKTNPRVIKNRMAFKHALKVVSGLTSAVRKIRLQMKKVLYGITLEQSRLKYCTDLTSWMFKMVISKMFVEKHFKSEAKTKMDDMVSLLKSNFKRGLRNATWMGNQTKQAAIEKLDNMGLKIGYPNTGFEYSDLSKDHKEYVVMGSYYQTLVLADMADTRKKLRNLNKRPNPSSWKGNLVPFAVNAAFHQSKNELIFPAGILQPPFFSNDYPNSINYGGIGMIIGHEITHGYDRGGSKYDKDGKLRDWWTKTDRENFKKRVKLHADFYSTLEIEQISMKENGIRSADESIADHGGLRVAFMAYNEISTKETELLLPDLNLTLAQQFYVGFAKSFCASYTDKRVRRNQRYNYPSMRNRIIGSIKMDENFGRVFNCTPGSPMNPVKKYRVW